MPRMNTVAFLPHIVCSDATIAPDLRSMNKIFMVKFWAYLSPSQMQCSNLHKKQKSSEVLHNSSMYSNI